MRDIAAQKFLAQRPDAAAVYVRIAEPRFETRAAAASTEILLYDEIGFWGVTARDFTKAMLDAGEGPITLRINSPGGDVFDGLAIYNAIKQRGGVTCVVDGIAASAASFIMLAGDTVQIHERAMVMVHRAWGVTVGNGPAHLETAATLEKIDGQLAGIYAAYAGGSDAEWLATMDAETWFTSSDAKTAKLVSSVIADAPPPPKASASVTADIRAAQMRRLRLAETSA